VGSEIVEFFKVNIGGGRGVSASHGDAADLKEKLVVEVEVVVIES